MNDRLLYERIFNQYHQRLLFYAHKLIDNWEQSEDIVMEAFESVFKKYLGLENNDQLSKLLHTAVKNGCLDELKRKRKEGIKYDHFAQYLEIPDVTENETIYLNVIERLYAGIEKLPPERRRIFKMGFLEGKKAPQIAMELGLSVFTVRHQRAAALKGLRIFMKQFKSVALVLKLP